MGKRAALLLIAMLAASSLIMVKSAFAQSIPKPSIPEFSVEFIDYPYDVPPTYSVDPYTGESVITEPGYRADNRSMKFIVKNQPFTSYVDANGNYISLYYNFRFKGHYEDKWNYYPYDADSNYSTASAIPRNASQSEYTTITLGMDIHGLRNVPAGGRIDFQVEALIGYENRVDFFFLGGEGYYYTFTGETSGWSNTQTITIGESQTPTPSPATPTPTAPNMGPTSPPSQGLLLTPEQQEIIIIVSVVVAIIVAGLGLLIYLIKRK